MKPINENCKCTNQPCCGSHVCKCHNEEETVKTYQYFDKGLDSYVVETNLLSFLEHIKEYMKHIEPNEEIKIVCKTMPLKEFNNLNQD